MADLTRFGYEDVNQDDELRRKTFHMQELDALTAANDEANVLVQGLPDTGGTIEGVYARCGVTPTGTVTSLTLDIHKNETTIFTTQTNRVIFPATAAGSQTANSTTIEVNKVYNNDRLSLDVDDIGDGVAGSHLAVAIVVKVDKPLDDD